MPDPSLGPLVDRLRQNLGSAGIAVLDEDLEAMAEKGFLNSILAFEVAMRGLDSSTVPEYPPNPAEEGAVPIGGFKVDATTAVYRRDPGSGGGILSAGILATAERLRSGEISPLDLIEASFERIAERDPSINAFQSYREEEARREALVAEAEIRGGRALGPLHGIPIAVKDLLDIEGMATTAGSRILADTVATRDSTAVARLRAAGAIIVGKTCMPEFAYSPGSNNDHYGPTCNPRDLTRDSGGSSSGSAAAVADGMVFAAVGSDTGGSVRIPASFCGIVGWKPAWGRASLAGSVSLAWSLDTLGALARNVRDAALLCAVMEAEAGRGPGSGAIKDHNYDINGTRIGVVRGEGKGKAAAPDDILAAWERGLDVLRSGGARLVDIEMEELPALRTINSAILAIEAAARHQGFQRTRLADYGDFPRLGLLAGWAYGPTDLLRARQALASRRERCLARFTDLDFITTPTMVSEAPPLGRPPKLTFTSPFNALGWPAISIPAGTGAAGLPVGLQLVGLPGNDERLLTIAAFVEEHIGG